MVLLDHFANKSNTFPLSLGGTGWYLVVLGQYGAVLVGTWCYKLSHETSTGHPTLLKPFILQLLSENQMLYFGFKKLLYCFVTGALIAHQHRIYLCCSSTYVFNGANLAKFACVS